MWNQWIGVNKEAFCVEGRFWTRPRRLVWKVDVWDWQWRGEDRGVLSQAPELEKHKALPWKHVANAVSGSLSSVLHSTVVVSRRSSEYAVWAARHLCFRQVVWLLNCLLTFSWRRDSAKIIIKVNFEECESTGWKGLNGKISETNDIIKVFLYRWKCGKVRIRSPVESMLLE